GGWALGITVGVGPRGRLFLGRGLNPPLQHLSHHAVVVTRCEVYRPNIELAVLVLAKPLRPGDDHRAYRIAAADVAVVIDFDTTRFSRQREDFGHCAKQLLLRGRIGGLARERLARVRQGLLYQFFTLASIWLAPLPFQLPF